MTFPLVSIVVPSYNHEKFIQRCIESLLKQDYSNIELLIIDDGSSDKSVNKLEALVSACKERFVRFELITRENKGLAATLNESLGWVEGKYYTAIASDDVMFANKISELVEHLESHSHYAVAFGDALFIDDLGQAIFLDPMTKSKPIQNNGVQSFIQVFTHGRELSILGHEFGKYHTLLAGNYLPAMSCLVKTAAIRDVGGWTEGVVIEDWDMWLKLSKKYAFTYLEKPVAYYRLHDTNTSKSALLKILLDSIKLLDKQKQYSTENHHLDVYFSAKIRLQWVIIKHDLSYVRMIPQELIQLPYLRYMLRMSTRKIMNYLRWS